MMDVERLDKQQLTTAASAAAAAATRERWMIKSTSRGVEALDV